MKLAEEEGSALVELAIAATTVLAVLFGIFELSMALYSYHFVSEAARDASRFAIVRGSQCAANFTPSYCSPTDAQTTGADGGDVSHYVNSLGYPFANKLSTSTTWLSASQDSSGNDIWTSCGTTPACKNPGNMVQITVSYPFPLNVPFVAPITIFDGDLAVGGSPVLCLRSTRTGTGDRSACPIVAAESTSHYDGAIY